MHKQIYVNLPVADLAKSKAFFGELGFAFEAKYTNDQAACLILGENIYAMLLVKPFFQTFTTRTIVDASTHVETLTCLSCASRAEVDELVAKALRAGGKAPGKPQDYGFMYGHAFDDLDGHTWELMFVDQNAAGPSAESSVESSVESLAESSAGSDPAGAASAP